MDAEFEKFIKDQCAHMQKHVEELKETLSEHIDDDKQFQGDVVKRLNVLERAKIYADGFKSGAVWAIGFGIASIVGAAVWIISKLSP